jgi:SAM-dependent methyltransferase
MTARYDRIGTTYTATRQPDPRVEAHIRAALGGATRVVNVGAGAGSYERAGPTVAAVEPSPVMLAQRGADAAPAVRAVAEHLPFPDGAFDAALMVFTVHHWTDWEAGLREVLRVAGRFVIMGWEPNIQHHFWLTSEYLPESLTDQQYTEASVADVESVAGPVEVIPVPIPADCVDGFFACYWARPEAYLDPTVRAGISCLSLLDQELVATRMAQLADDLDSGSWDARHPGLRELPELDVGYRLLVSSG